MEFSDASVWIFAAEWINRVCPAGVVCVCGMCVNLDASEFAASGMRLRRCNIFC